MCIDAFWTLSNRWGEAQSMRVLVLRPDEIGDCVLFSGYLRGIRLKWPTAKIHLMVQPHIRNLFEMCPYVDRVLSTDRLMPWRWMQRRAMRGAWKLEAIKDWAAFLIFWYPRYDLVIYPVSAPSEEMLSAVRQIKALDKWGCGGFMFRQKKFKDEANRPERVFTVCPKLSEADHWVDELSRNASVLKAMGIDVQTMWPEFWLSPEDELWAEQMMPKSKVLGIFPGASSKWRLWPVEKWHAFLAAQEVSDQVVVMGGLGEQKLARQIMAMGCDSRCHFTDLTGKTSLRQMVACIKRCSWMVSMETSGLHIAVACHIPTVGVTGGNHYGRYYPWGDARINRVACVEMLCFRCNRECDYGDYRCVANIEVNRVLAELQMTVDNSRSEDGSCYETT